MLLITTACERLVVKVRVRVRRRDLGRAREKG